MTDQPIQPAYPQRSRPMVRSAPRQGAPRFVEDENRSQPTERKIGFVASLDKPMMIMVFLLLVVGAMMIFSTTFDGSSATRGSPTAFFVEEHLRNVVMGVAAMAFFSFIDYRFWKRFAIWLLLITIAALIAVLLFGDDTFGARRSLIGGRFQPGELAEFTIVVYLSAWLGSKTTKPRSFAFGLIPFGVLISIIAGLIILQPDLSSAAVIILTAGRDVFPRRCAGLASHLNWYLYSSGRLACRPEPTLCSESCGRLSGSGQQSYRSGLSYPTSDYLLCEWGMVWRWLGAKYTED